MPETLDRARNDLAAAGAAWILCKREDERTREAIEALREEPHLLRVRAPMESWPTVVQERLRAFGAEPEPDAEPPPPQPSTVADGFFIAGCLIVVVAIGVFAVIGFVAALDWL